MGKLIHDELTISGTTLTVSGGTLTVSGKVIWLRGNAYLMDIPLFSIQLAQGMQAALDRPDPCRSLGRVRPLPSLRVSPSAFWASLPAPSAPVPTSSAALRPPAVEAASLRGGSPSLARGVE